MEAKDERGNVARIVKVTDDADPDKPAEFFVESAIKLSTEGRARTMFSWIERFISGARGV